MRADQSHAPAEIEIYELGMQHPRGAFVYDSREPLRVVHEIIDERPNCASRSRAMCIPSANR